MPRPDAPAIAVELVPGEEHWWCHCPARGQPPGASHSSACQPLRVTSSRPRIVWLCGCGHTAEPPWCDGSHKQAKASGRAGSA